MQGNGTQRARALRARRKGGRQQLEEETHEDGFLFALSMVAAQLVLGRAWLTAAPLIDRKGGRRSSPPNS
eukprot:3966436-Pyramimonas_sp.AAC.1